MNTVELGHIARHLWHFSPGVAICAALGGYFGYSLWTPKNPSECFTHPQIQSMQDVLRFTLTPPVRQACNNSLGSDMLGTVGIWEPIGGAMLGAVICGLIGLIGLAIWQNSHPSSRLLHW